MATSSLLSSLHRLASRQDENFLTEVLAYLVRALVADDPDSGRSVLTLLVPGLSGSDHGPVSVVTQRNLPEGRPDIEIVTPEHLAYVEVKVESAPGATQLQRYRRALARSGYPSTSLVLLTRHPILIDGPDQPDTVIRWHQIAHCLASLNSASAECRFLLDQTTTFLRERGLAMDHVGWDLPSGIRSIRSLVTMIGEAAAAMKLPQVTRSIAWGWFGYYLLNKKCFLGVYADQPHLLIFEVYDVPNDADAFRALGIGRWDTNKWIRESDLTSEDVHFFARPQASQLRYVEDYLAESLRLAEGITGPLRNHPTENVTVRKGVGPTCMREKTDAEVATADGSEHEQVRGGAPSPA